MYIIKRSDGHTIRILLKRDNIEPYLAVGQPMDNIIQNVGLRKFRAVITGRHIIIRSDILNTKDKCIQWIYQERGWDYVNDKQNTRVKTAKTLFKELGLEPVDLAHGTVVYRDVSLTKEVYFRPSDKSYVANHNLYSMHITPDLHKAICQQMKELGWTK